MVFHLLPPFPSVRVIQVPDFSVCSALFINTPSQIDLSITIPRVILGITFLILAFIPTLKQLVEMYRATKQWQPNKYMQLLMREGILYFLVYVSFPAFSIPLITIHSSACLILEYLHKN